MVDKVLGESVVGGFSPSGGFCHRRGDISMGTSYPDLLHCSFLNHQRELRVSGDG